MESLLKKVNELYGLNIVSFEKVTKGCLSKNYVLIGDKNKYFLKKYRFDNSDRIKEVHSVKKYFSVGGISVIIPILNINNETFFFYNKGYFTLFPFINDKQFKRGELTNTAIISLGETLGKIHLLGKQATLPIKDLFKIWDKEKALNKISLLEAMIFKKEVLSDFDQIALENLGLKKKLINKNSVTYKDINLPFNHLIHGDYLDHNVFFDENNKVSNVFDFEKTNYSPRTYELFRSLIYAFLNEKFYKDNMEKAKLYLSSYLSIYPTSRDELIKGLKLFYLKNIHTVWIETEHYINSNYRVDEFMELDLQRIKYLSNDLDKFTEELLIDIK